MYFTRGHRSSVATVRVLSIVLTLFMMTVLMILPNTAYASEHSFYKQTNLVSDQPGVAKFTDPLLANAWGIAYNPTGPFWIADNHSGVSELFNGKGQAFPLAAPLVVTVPLPGGGASSPTGVVFNGTNDFVVSANGKSGPSRFIFDSEDGTISGWNPTVDLKQAVLTVDHSASGAVYKGLAIGQDNGRDLIFATNFNAGVVEVYDTNFKWVQSFTDDDVPAGYAPFGIQNIGGWLYVTFAKQDAAKHDDAHGPHRGFVDVFSTDGSLVKRLASRGTLNSPWGLAKAPDNFGRFSDALLVGNFGDGRINAFDPHSGSFLGTVRDKWGHAISIDGLWGLSFGNGNVAGELNELFFTAGPNGENNGLFGKIQHEDQE